MYISGILYFGFSGYIYIYHQLKHFTAAMTSYMYVSDSIEL